MREHLVSKDSIGDLRSIQEIHLKQSGLLGTLIGSVILQCVEEEGSCLRNHILRKKYIDNTININDTSALFIGELICKLRPFLRIQSNDVLEKSSIIGSISSLF